jgi:hypothetical protein
MNPERRRRILLLGPSRARQKGDESDKLGTSPFVTMFSFIEAWVVCMNSERRRRILLLGPSRARQKGDESDKLGTSPFVQK